MVDIGDGWTVYYVENEGVPLSRDGTHCPKGITVDLLQGLLRHFVDLKLKGRIVGIPQKK